MIPSDDSIAALREALRHSPDNIPLHKHLSESLLKLGRFDEAESAYRDALAVAPHHVEFICPHRQGCVRPASHDGRPLRRYRRRWIIERTIGWLQSFRRLVTRYEFYAFFFHSFAKLACLMIVLRRF